MNNNKIRTYAKEKKVFLWEIAKELGMMDCNFSRKLRNDLSHKEAEKIIAIIDKISKSKD